jgi:hypothetical protein
MDRHDTPPQSCATCAPRSSDQRFQGELEAPDPDVADHRAWRKKGDPTSRGWPRRFRRPRQRGPDSIVTCELGMTTRQIKAAASGATGCRGNAQRAGRGHGGLRVSVAQLFPALTATVEAKCDARSGSDPENLELSKCLPACPRERTSELQRSRGGKTYRHWLPVRLSRWDRSAQFGRTPAPMAPDVGLDVNLISVLP